MNPLNFIMNLSLQTKLFMIAGVVIVSFAAGWQVHGWKYKATQGVSLGKQLKTSDSLAKDTKAQVKITQKNLADTKIIYRTIKERIHDENDNRICFADAAALGLWNDAIAGKNTPRPIATGAPAETNAIIATVEEVLSNAADNFETCNTNAIHHNALIDRIEALDGKMCVCSQLK